MPKIEVKALDWPLNVVAIPTNYVFWAFMLSFKVFTEEFKAAKFYIADWIAAFASFKLMSPLWRPANAYERASFAWSKVVVKPEVEVCVGVLEVIKLRFWVAVVKAVWIAVSDVFYESRAVPVY